MTPEELFRSARLEECLATLQGVVRRDPQKAELRSFLYSLYCVLGAWQKARNQLDALESLDPQYKWFATSQKPLLDSIPIRAAVMRCESTPMIVGEPEPWMATFFQSRSLLAAGKGDESRDLRRSALDLAPAVAGSLNGTNFEWLGDADAGFGPFIEAVIWGRYYWIPVHQVRAIKAEASKTPVDLVWFPVLIQFVNQGEVGGYLFSRYPGTEESSDNLLRLCQKTDWVEKVPGTQTGLGQRLLATDTNDLPLLDLRLLHVGKG